MAHFETPVLIVGGGPVGLTLAAELAWRGNRCMLIEERIAPTEHPKATLLGARSMEYFRRWGITEDIIAAALPADINYGISFSTRLTGRELHRVTSPSIRETREQRPETLAKYRELAWSPFYKTQIGQQALEPVLWRFAQAQPPLTLKHGWSFTGFEERPDCVIAQVRERASGATHTVTAQHLVACDGGASSIRRQLGIRYNGRGQMRANVSFYFRSAEFLTTHALGVCNLYFIFTPDSFGVFTAIDGRERWSYQHYFLDETKQTRDLDATAILHRAMGAPFAFELQAVQHWHHHQSVARQWRSSAGRVFLAGDAAHLFVPTGGVGMNTGIGDAIDLAWKLDGVFKSWGGAALLASYEAERKPIAVRNSVISANNSDKIDMVMDETPADIERDDAHGDHLRALLAKKIRWMSRQFNSAGTHLGYRYVDSPVILHDGSHEPPDDFMQVVPSTWPGSRAPHAWVEPGTRSTLDSFGRDWALIRTSHMQGDELLSAARSRGLTIQPVDFLRADLASLYQRALVLVRPDGHVAWRGDQDPRDPMAVIDTVRGGPTSN